MKICIYGAGSLGTILGAYLSRNGLDVDLVTRNKEHVKGLNESGARVVGKVEFSTPVKALLPKDMKETYDYIFLMTKQQDNSSVVEELRGFMTDKGILCTFQNGIPEYEIAEILDSGKVYGCAVGWGATLLGKGVCELTSDPDKLVFNLGQFDPSCASRIPEIKSILENMGTVVVEENFIGARWSKLLINSAFSGISTALGCSFGEAAADKQSRVFIQKVMKECIDVARSLGVNLEPVQGKDIVKLFDYKSALKRRISFFLIPFAIKTHADLKASMLQDLEKGKKTEVDFINGLVSSQGRRGGVPTPVNDRVVSIIHKIEAGALSPGRENLGLLN